MTQKDAEKTGNAGNAENAPAAGNADDTDGLDHGTGPWWTDLGTWGAVALVVTGVLAVAWVFLRLPGTPENVDNAYYGPAKIVAIGLVITGSAVLGRRRRVSPKPSEEALPVSEVPDSKG